MSEQNKAAARIAFEVWSRGDLDRLDQVLASEVVHHDPYDPHGAEGLAGMKESITRMRGMYPDLQMTVEDQVAEGDKVATPHRSVQGDRLVREFCSLSLFRRARALCTSD